MCIIGPDSIFTIYSNDERQRKTIGTGYDMEKGESGPRLGVFSNCIITDN
jgi:hypothetical protein